MLKNATKMTITSKFHMSATCRSHEDHMLVNEGHMVTWRSHEGHMHNDIPWHWPALANSTSILGSVAEKSRVCLVSGSRRRISCSWSENPISNNLDVRCEHTQHSSAVIMQIRSPELTQYKYIGELILSRYIAESIATKFRMFRPHRPLSAAYKTVLCAADEGYEAENALQSAVIESATYVFAQDQFASIKQRSNEPLPHYN